MLVGLMCGIYAYTILIYVYTYTYLCCRCEKMPVLLLFFLLFAPCLADLMLFFLLERVGSDMMLEGHRVVSVWLCMDW